LRKAHEYKESFREIYEKVNDKEEGQLKFTEWLNKAKEIYTDVIGRHWFSLIIRMKSLQDKDLTENTKLKKLFPS
jgi:hypothetical protein